jgi:phenylacetate-CoA ligase
MSFFQLHPPAGTAWPPLPDGALAQVWCAYQTLDRGQWLSPAEIAAGQLSQVRALLAHCAAHSPHYGRLLAEAGVSAEGVRSMDDFRRIPLLSRETYQARFAELACGSLPPGVVKTHETYSSGTNGVPVTVHQTNQVAFWWSVFCMRDLEWCGLDPRGTLAAIRLLPRPDRTAGPASPSVVNPYWVRSLAQLIEQGPSHSLDVHHDPRRQLEWLRQVQPDYLLSMPSNLEFLAGLIEESGQALAGLRAIQTIGETVTDEARTCIETAFRAPVKNTYSCTEAGYLASPCPAGHGLHVHAENVILEVLDARDRPCPPGQAGRVVLTALRNFLTPFIRYDILDEAVLAPGVCPCGRGLPLLTSVQGRRHPLFYLPGGKRKIATGLYLELRKAGGTRQFQIVQRGVEHVLLRVVPNRAWTPEHPQRLRRLVCEHFEAPIRVDVELHENRLELPPGGKLRIGVIEMDGG